MVSTRLQSFKITLHLIIVHILFASSPLQASRSKGYYDNNDNSYKPTYTHHKHETPQEYKSYYNPTPTSPPYNPAPTSSSNQTPTNPPHNQTPNPTSPPNPTQRNPTPNPISPPHNPTPNPTSPPNPTQRNPTPNPTSPPNPTQRNLTPNPTSPPHNKDGQAQQRHHDTKLSSSDKNAFLQGHNMARANVGLPPMSWDDKVASYAQWWANHRINDCRVVHSDTSYGENVFWGSGGYSAAFAVQSWVNERKYYDYNSNSCKRGMDCGHYTQTVWKKSTRLGCARVRCNNGGVFITCNYDPPGNYVGTRPY